MNKEVLELGAGTGLPSLVACNMGAKEVVITDRPNAEIVKLLHDTIRISRLKNCSVVSSFTCVFECYFVIYLFYPMTRIHWIGLLAFYPLDMLMSYLALMFCTPLKVSDEMK